MKRTIHGWNADYKYEAENVSCNGVLVFRSNWLDQWEYKCSCQDMESAIAMIEHYQTEWNESGKYICIKHSNLQVVTSKVKKTEISQEEIDKRRNAICD